MPTFRRKPRPGEVRSLVEDPTKQWKKHLNLISLNFFHEHLEPCSNEQSLCPKAERIVPPQATGANGQSRDYASPLQQPWETPIPAFPRGFHIKPGRLYTGSASPMDYSIKGASRSCAVHIPHNSMCEP